MHPPALAAMAASILFQLLPAQAAPPDRTGKTNAAEADAPAGATAEAIGERLDQARVRYEEQMESLRAEVRTCFQKAIDALGKAAEVDKDAIKALIAERDAFGSNTSWPDVDGIDALRQKEARIARDLRNAYALAFSGYDKAGRKDLRDAIDAESTRFARQIDRAPWTALDVAAAVVAKDEQGRELLRTLSLVPEDSYRLELVAHRTVGAGPIEFEIPQPDGKRVRLAAPVDAAGACRVLLTWSANGISADLGLPRPAAAVAVPDAKDHGLVLRCDAGRVRLVAARWKHLTEGKVDDVAEAAATKPPATTKPPQRAPRPTAAQLLTPGRKVAGRRTVAGVAPFTYSGSVIANDGTTITVRLNGNDGAWDWVFKVVGERSLTLKNLTGARPKQLHISGPDGTFVVNERGISGKYSFRRPEGRYTVKPSGSLTITFD